MLRIREVGHEGVKWLTYHEDGWNISEIRKLHLSRVVHMARDTEAVIRYLLQRGHYEGIA